MIEIDLKQIEALAMYDLSLEEMAVVLNVHHSTLYRRLANPETQKDFQNALDRGRAKLKSKLKTTLINEATKKNPNTAALIFLNKNYSTTSDGKPYTDRQQVDHTGKVENIHTINVNISADEARRQLAQLMQDEEVKQFMLADGAQTIEASFDNAVISGTGSNKPNGKFSAAAVVSDAGGNHTTGEASADNSSASGTSRGDRSSARTRRKKGARRRNGARSRTKTSAKQRAERKDS